jgi:hypothetical protein
MAVYRRANRKEQTVDLAVNLRRRQADGNKSMKNTWVSKRHSGTLT